jgi:hypothetical protein
MHERRYMHIDIFFSFQFAFESLFLTKIRIEETLKSTLIKINEFTFSVLYIRL